jgi:arginine-tRNA-protein transferase
MTRDISPDIAKIQLYLTEPHPCSYLEDKAAITAYVDPKTDVNDLTYNYLSEKGFRRSGQYIYAPRCITCKACIPVRIPAAKFKPNRSQRRCLNKNTDITTRLTTSIDVDEHYSIYHKYIATRHTDGDMYPATMGQFKSFIGTAWDCTRYLEFRLEDKLICCALIDLLSTGMSAIYTYFDPDYSSRSLGTYSILRQIETTVDHNLDHVYLGYWIRDSAKMNYKTNFRPLQFYLENHWMSIS